MAILGIGIFLFLVLVISVIAYTPVRELIPGYPDENTIRNIHLNNYRLDSLELEIAKRDAYFENLRRIIAGERPHDLDEGRDSSGKHTGPVFKKSKEDSLLRQMVEPNDRFSLATIEKKVIHTALSSTLFFPPVKGMVTNAYSSKNEHYGIDIVASSSEVVKATLPGMVTLAAWTLETGYVIQLQHENNIISIYKHNAELLKHIGDRVKAGEPIAIIGNSGELTTGPHLHFELWHNGTSLNPQDYITF
jgi:murein DD-endopeptidase MepM/ murein hydrolase activator NlpD